MNSTPLSLSLPHSQIHTDKGGNLSTRMGLFLPSVGQWSLLCTHVLPVSPVSSNSLCLISETLQLADSTLYLFLCCLSLFLKTRFRVVVFFTQQLKPAMHGWLRQACENSEEIQHLCMCVTYSFTFIHFVHTLGSALNTKKHLHFLLYLTTACCQVFCS